MSAFAAAIAGLVITASASSTWRDRTISGSARSMTSMTRATTCERTMRNVSSNSSGPSTWPPGRSATIESTAAARQSCNKSGTLPCGLWPSASRWALVNSASTRFHGAVVLSSSRRRTPSLVAASRSCGEASTSTATLSPWSTTAGNPWINRSPTRCSKVAGSAPKAHCCRPFRSTDAAARRIVWRSCGASCCCSADSSLPSPTVVPPRSSTRNVMRRWSGTRAQSHSSAGMRTPVSSRRARPSSSVR